MNPRRFLLALPALALLGACASLAPTPVTDVAGTVARDPELSTLHGLVTRAGLADTLKAAGPYTLFAPTNAAFQAVPAKTLDELGADPARLKQLLQYHVLPAKLPAGDLRPGNQKTVQGGNVALARAGDFVTVEEAMVLQADVAASNGVVHKVDRVLMPPRR